MSLKCPCCGHPLKKNREADIVPHLFDFTILERRIVTALADCYPREADYDYIIGRMYDWDREEPENSKGVVKQLIHRIRKKMRGHTWAIFNEHTGNGNEARYRLGRLS